MVLAAAPKWVADATALPPDPDPASAPSRAADEADGRVLDSSSKRAPELSAVLALGLRDRVSAF